MTLAITALMHTVRKFVTGLSHGVPKEQITHHAPTACVLFMLTCLLIPAAVNAQESAMPPDKKTRQEKPIVIPPRASMLSAVMPGMGQVYNRRIWKVPIIYAGFGAVAYFVELNNNEYQKFRSAYIARIDGNPNTVDEFPFHSTDVLQRAVNYYRRNLEVTYLLGVALYLLNILDANVDAHLMDFDVGDSLSLGFFQAAPMGTPGIHQAGRLPQFGLRINL